MEVLRRLNNCLKYLTAEIYWIKRFKKLWSSCSKYLGSITKRIECFSITISPFWYSHPFPPKIFHFIQKLFIAWSSIFLISVVIFDILIHGCLEKSYWTYPHTLYIYIYIYMFVRVCVCVCVCVFCFCLFTFFHYSFFLHRSYSAH
jgi:hypothetical protein